jgi:spermidine/putrescine transport system substrate-binding protein
MIQLKNNRFYRLFCTTFLLAFIVVGCTATGSPVSPTATPTVADTDNVLRVYNWGTYIDPQILDDFSEIYGVTVEYSTFDDNLAMLNDVRAGDVYDVVVALDFVVEIMRKERLLQTINHDNIPNLENLSEQFVSPSYDPGNRYCAAYQWGTIGIGYNSNTVDGEIVGWKDFFDPKYAGKIAMLDDSRSSLAVTLLYLGYSPNTTNQSEIQAAVSFLEERKDSIAAFAPDTGQDMLLSGDVDLALEWSGDIFQAIEENPALKYVIPEEGTIVWTDNMCIPENAGNPELAELFINYILDAEVGAQLSNFVRYASPNEASLPLINDEDRNNRAIYPPPVVTDRLFSLVSLDSTSNAIYDNLWEQLTTDAP